MRKYNIASDLVQVKAIQPVVYKQYDNGDNLEIELFKDGEKITLTTETVLAFFELEDGTVNEKTCTINNGNAVATLDNNILSQSGELKVEFTIFKDGKETTTRTLLITVERSINRGEAIETIPQWDIVNQVLDLKASDGAAIEDKINTLNQAVEDKYDQLSAAKQVDAEVILARGKEVNLKARLDKSDASLADIAIFDNGSKIDDREQLQDMINSASGKGTSVSLKPNHTYIINSLNPNDFYNLLTIKPNTKIIGNGATIKVVDGLNDLAPQVGSTYAFPFNNVFGTSESAIVNNGNISFENLNFDLNGQNNKMVSPKKKNNCAIFVDKFDKVVIKNCVMENTPGNQVIFLIKPNANADVIIENNKIKNVADAIDGNYSFDHSSVYIVSEFAIVRGNTFENGTMPSNAACIEVHCKYSYVYENTLINYTHGIYPAAHSASYNVTTNIDTCFVENNVFVNNSAPFVLWTALNDGGSPTSIKTVKFNNNKLYCTGGSNFINANTELRGNGVDRFEFMNNEIICDTTGGSVIQVSEKVKELKVKDNIFKDSNNLVIYSRAIINVIEDNDFINCSRVGTQKAIVWIDGTSDVLRIKNNNISQTTPYALYALKLTNTVVDGEILDNNITGFTDNQIIFSGNGILATNKCSVRHKSAGDYYASIYGSNGSEYTNTINGAQYVIEGTLFSKSWVNASKIMRATFDTTRLPDSFKVGTSISLVNGDTALPSTNKQGILKTEKINEAVGYRKFTTQWFYPANHESITLADMYFRKANAATNDWSVWKKITGV